MGGSSPPTPPDPTQVAQQGAAQNKATAIAQYGLNATNQNTPHGSLSYEQIGTWADGTPRFQATQSYSPEQQGLYQQQTGLQSQFGDLAGKQLGNVSAALATPYKSGNEATESRLMQLGQSRLDPIFDLRQSQLESQLANQGITRGSEAWDNAHNQFGRDRNDAYNQLLLSGRQTADTEGLAERNQPMQELGALFGYTQPTNPNYTQTPQAGVAPVDVAGIYNNNYQGQMAAYNAQQAKQGAMIGGIAGMGGTALGGWARGGFATPKFG